MVIQRRLTLVSASPRRRELLARLGIPFDVAPSHAHEIWYGGSTEFIAEQNATRKVERSTQWGDRSRVFIGADTIVESEFGPIGKPYGPESARRMLELISGKRHRVVTGVCMAGYHGNSTNHPIVSTSSSLTVVRFRPLSARDISSYVRGGEWRGCAGAYAIQGAAGEFVHSWEGDYDNVVGLPLKLVKSIMTTYFGQIEFH